MAKMIDPRIPPLRRPRSVAATAWMGTRRAEDVRIRDLRRPVENPHFTSTPSYSSVAARRLHRAHQEVDYQSAADCQPALTRKRDDLR